MFTKRNCEAGLGSVAGLEWVEDAVLPKPMHALCVLEGRCGLSRVQHVGRTLSLLIPTSMIPRNPWWGLDLHMTR